LFLDEDRRIVSQTPQLEPCSA